MEKLTYEDFKARISIQEVLIDAGYTLNRRDGLRYPSYVRLDNEGKRIRGDKFIVTANGLCCFQPPEQRTYNIIGFIKEHPELFAEYQYGMDKDRLVNLVCNRLLNHPIEDKETKIIEPKRDMPPFRIKDYQIHKFVVEDVESQKPFSPYFKSRGINIGTQYAFHQDFVLAEHTKSDGKSYKSLCFPMSIPGKEGIVGFEERGRPNAEGKAFKGMALGSNASEGLWMASPTHTPLDKAKHVIVVESAYDAMAFYQLLMYGEGDLSPEDKIDVKEAVYASTGGTPSICQIQGLLKQAPQALFHLAFDNDKAGQQFADHFKLIAQEVGARTVREEPLDGYKDFNDMLLDKKTEEQHQGLKR